MDRLFEFISNHPVLVGTFLLLLALFIRNEMRRGGKTVTVVKNFVGIGLPEKEALAKKMQKKTNLVPSFMN